MSKVWVLAGEPIFRSLKKALAGSTSSGAAITLGQLAPAQQPPKDDVLLFHSDTDVSAAGHLTACDWAAALRRDGHKGPIVLLSPETLKTAPPSDGEASSSSVTAYLGDVSTPLPWFAPLYDVAVELPSCNHRILPAVRAALDRRGKRPSLVENAIAHAWESDFDQRGRSADHLWKGAEAVLRFLRGAQSEWMIHPDDADDIMRHIKQKVEEDQKRSATEMVFSDEVRSHLSDLDKSQSERWSRYRLACDDRKRAGKHIQRLRQYQHEGLRYRLLLIDDDWDCLGWKTLLQCLLAPDGFDVVANDGVTGDEEQSLEEQLKGALKPIDVILLDLGLRTRRKPSARSTGLEGFEVLDIIEEHAPHIPVILFTGTESIALERRSHRQRGIAGYIVKEEQEVEGTRKARDYYGRLRSLCRGAIDHQIRSLLVGLTHDLADLNPTLHEAISKRLYSALEELDDPLAACHHSGLAFETALTFEYKKRLDDAMRDFGTAMRKTPYEPFQNWAYLEKSLRNVSAHPQLGAEYLQPLDALFSCSLTVTVLYLITQDGGASAVAKALPTSRLLTLALHRCRDELRAISANNGNAIATLRMQGGAKDLEKRINGVSTALKKASSTLSATDVTDALGQLYDLVKEVLCAVCITVTAARIPGTLQSSCQRLYGVFMFDTGRGPSAPKPRERYTRAGYLHSGAGSMSHVDNAAVGNLDRHTLLNKYTGNEHRFLSLLTMTRLMDWAVSNVLTQSNPANKAMLMAGLKLKPEGVSKTKLKVLLAAEADFKQWMDDSLQLHELSRQSPAFAAFVAAVFAARKAEHLSAALIDLGERALADLAKRLLLETNIEVKQIPQLEHQEKELRKEITTSKKSMDECSEEHEKAYKAGASDEQLKEVRSKAENHFQAHLKAHHDWSAVQAKLTRMKRLQSTLRPKKELRAYEKLKEAIGEAPRFTTEIVEECAGHTLGELEQVRLCLRSWAWTNERDELPQLICDLHQMWDYHFAVASP